MKDFSVFFPCLHCIWDRLLEFPYTFPGEWIVPLVSARLPSDFTFPCSPFSHPFSHLRQEPSSPSQMTTVFLTLYLQGLFFFSFLCFRHIFTTYESPDSILLISFVFMWVRFAEYLDGCLSSVWETSWLLCLQILCIIVGFSWFPLRLHAHTYLLMFLMHCELFVCLMWVWLLLLLFFIILRQGLTMKGWLA